MAGESRVTAEPDAVAAGADDDVPTADRAAVPDAAAPDDAGPVVADDAATADAETDDAAGDAEALNAEPQDVLEPQDDPEPAEAEPTDPELADPEPELAEPESEPMEPVEVQAVQPEPADPKPAAAEADAPDPEKPLAPAPDDTAVDLPPVPGEPGSQLQPGPQPEPAPQQEPAAEPAAAVPTRSVPPMVPHRPVTEAPAAAPAGPPRRRILIGAAVALALVVVYVGLAWAVSGRVPRGTTVAGVDIGGVGRAAAETRLTDAATRAGRALPVVAGDARLDLDVAAAGLTVDAAATVDRVVGFTLAPAGVWRHVAGGDAQAVVPRGGTDRVGPALEKLSAEVRTASKDAAVGFAATGPVLRPAVVGRDLDLAAAATAVRTGWLAGARPLPLPVREVQPEVTQAEAEAALDELARPALAGPLTLVVGDRTVAMQPAQLAPVLALAPGDGGALDLRVDGAKLRDAVLAATPELGVKPKDARIELRDGTPVVVPAVDGVTIDPAALVAAVRPALTAAGAERRATVATAVQQPKLTTAKAKALGVKERVSTFSTNLTADSLRTENLRVAARTVNGTLVLPGETFSLNGVLGQRTPEKGYNQAPAISGGRLIRDYGGGVSQMATTIFNNVFFAGLEDVYHKPHSFYISRYPEGREATVNWPTVDLKWKNDSPHAVLIEASVGNQVNVSFYSTKVWEKVTAQKSGRSNFRTPEVLFDDSPGCVTQVASPGFDVSVRRLFHRDGRVVRTETFNTTYIAEDKVTCGPDPAKRKAPGQDRDTAGTDRSGD